MSYGFCEDVERPNNESCVYLLSFLCENEPRHPKQNYIRVISQQRSHTHCVVYQCPTI